MELLVEHQAEVAHFAREQGWISAEASFAEVAGVGNMNRTLRLVTPSESIVLKQSVPFVAKYPDIPAPLNRDRVEAAFYQAIEGTPMAAKMPRFLGHARELHLLAFEDLGSAADCTDAYEGADLASEIPELVSWLKGLHDLSVDRELFTNRQMRALNHEHIFGLPFVDNGAPELRQRAAALGESYLSDGMQLLHGDYYPGSWLRTDSGIRIIDPEFAFAGCPEFDLGVLIAHLVFAGSPDLTERVLDMYGRADVDDGLAYGFAGVEVLRRIWGVAKLPFSRDTSADETGWIDWAQNKVMSP